MKNNRQTTIGQYFNKMQKDRIQQQKQTTPIKKIKQIQKVEVSKYDDNNQKQEKVIELDISGSQSSSVQISKSSQKKQQEIVKQQSKNMNVLFYTNRIASIPDGDYIDNFHHKNKKWWDNYQILQAHHGFIQWLFPNAFQSRFNRCAMPLNQQQIKQFQNNIEIAQRYRTSYVMMLQFYGLKLKCKKTGEITHCRKPMSNNKVSVMNQKKNFWQDRYHKTFLTSFHNHMRITRILSSLVICGFGRYARQLSIFLSKQINKRGGGLQDLKKYGIYERQWKQYSEYVQKQLQTNILLKNYDKNDKK